jgi:hypothetical protein
MVTVKTDLAGVTSWGQIFYTTDLANWQTCPGTLSRLTCGDFDGDGVDGLAGVTSDGSIYSTNDLFNWYQIPGKLSQIIAADVNGDGKDDLAGLTSGGQIYYTTDLAIWQLMTATAFDAGPQTQPGPYVLQYAQEICAGHDCSTTWVKLKSISEWMYTNLVNQKPCGSDRFSLTAEQLLSPEYQCYSGCTQFGTVFLALARQLGIPCSYVETLSEQSMAEIRAGIWPHYMVGHIFSLIYEPESGEIMYVNPGGWQEAPFVPPVHILAMSEGILWSLEIVAIGKDAWDVGFYSDESAHEIIEYKYCPDHVSR